MILRGMKLSFFRQLAANIAKTFLWAIYCV